ncbi:YbfB/YjiJ family MFS transporter [Blastococcus haudaquaticus]|uniref:Predicted arabinose efflux permease, MFS family n=1 Tax=Blastococcus haudaquaticus TaxID=1938745 RepID=A0A286GQ93_9ACTN|nr:YbfB/YjiJ family MFS transporter [Blastococcus haudaquaticus]SOD97693.1 Predicted arabinose efflux permease, MFS family [Blastococcus haudaquaticus]
MVKRSFQSGTATTGAPALVASGAGLIAVTYGVVRYGYGLQLPRLTAEFSLSPRAAGAIAAGSFAAYCAAALAAQRMIARRGARVLLWLAAGLAASGALLVALSWSAPTLALGVLVAGSAAGAASPALVVAIASTVRHPLAARAQAVVNAGTGLGVALTGAAVLAAPQAWRPVWVGAAAAALLTAAAVDRRARWPAVAQRPAATAHSPATPMRRPVLAAAVAGTGSAAVWTFGRDLITTTGGLPERTTAVLWCLLGAAAVLGALSGDAVRVLGLRRAWGLTATLSAAGTAVLALAPGSAPSAALAGAVFGGAYTALSGVLIAWAGVLRPAAAGRGTATLFTALTAGQAVGALATGVLADQAGTQTAFWAGAAVLLAAAGVLPAGTTADRHAG